MGIFLETERLILKSPELADFDNLLALRSDPEVMKYIGNGATQTPEQVRNFLTLAIPYQENHGIGFCTVFEKESGNFIGQAGLLHLELNEKQPEIEIAYRLHSSYWGKGYASELAKPLIRWGFDHLPITKLVAITHPNNTASQNVLKKAGLDYRGKRNIGGIEVFWYEIYKNNAVELVPYDTQWPILAKLEIKKLSEVLPKNHILDMQHVGSTAIPGISAKPIIDIQIAVDSLTAVKPIAIDVLKTLDYEYWTDNPDPERLFFVKGMPPFGEKRTHHVHIVEPTSCHWQGKILFRDYLLAHPEVANEYVNLKKELAQQHTYDREQYTDAKSKFISEILKKANDGIKSSHEKIITTLINFHYKCQPQFIRRIAIGICNEVYEVVLVNKTVIVRLSSEKRFLMGSHDHIPKFKNLNIRVPEILAEDYSKKLVPFAYQIQNKIEGKDLGYVIESLTDEQLKILAKEIASIFKKVKTIPASNQFGVVWGGGDNELSETWTERMKIWIEESTERGMKTGVMDNEMLMLAKNLYDKYHSYFDSIKPITYYGDICSKNVMVKDGVFSGLVDLDGLTQGDPLEAIGRIKLSWYGTRHGEIYTNAVMDELGLNDRERKLVLVYSLFNKISWTCENGIQFNQNTTAVVDKEKEKIDKKIIKEIAIELGDEV